MSWFGETFGDSLSLLKGQITKITKEVLAEDAPSGSENQESEVPLVKELEALCESKDVEIASLKAEFNKFFQENQLDAKPLKSTNDSKTSSADCDNDDLKIKILENELLETRQERDYLKSCIDELQSENEINIKQVLSLADKYKSELNELKKECSALKSKLNETSNSVNLNETNENKSGENAEVKELQLNLRSDNGKEKTSNDSKKEVEIQNDLQDQLNKLLGEVQQLNKIKEEVEEDKKKFIIENEELKNKLNLLKKENTEIQVKLKLVLKEKEDLSNQNQSQELLISQLSNSIAVEAEIQQKLENMLQVLDIRPTEKIGLGEMIDLVENRFREKFSEADKKWKEAISDLELELKNLKEENRTVQAKLKVSFEKESEMEKNHKQEILALKSSLSEMKNQEQDLMHHCQTDDVKRLEQEIAQLMNLILIKDKEIANNSVSLNSMEQELKDLKESLSNIKKELETSNDEKKKLQNEIENLRNFSLKINQKKTELEEKQNVLEAEKISLDQINFQLKSQLDKLEKEVTELACGNEKFKIMEEEMQKIIYSKTELEKRFEELQTENLLLKNDCEYLKAQGIIKESNAAELMKANKDFQNKIAELQTQCDALLDSEKEIDKWKNTSVSLQIQIEDLIEKKEELENECSKLKSELEGSRSRDAEIQQLNLTNSNLMKSCNELHQQMEHKAQELKFWISKENESEEKCKNQSEVILQLQEENSELKSRIQKFQQELKTQMLQSSSLLAPKEEIQQHRRSKSAADTESHGIFNNHQSEAQKNEELIVLKEALQLEQAKNQLLQNQFLEISNKEASARKEFERLKQHLIEVEDHYTEESVESEKKINDLKLKLVAAEEQLQNSSTLYTSLKVRDSQHLESLQSQIRMVTAQRDDLQVKLSVAEDEVQKHKASLMSLQIVLEQFQQDKEREIEQVAIKYKQQLKLSDARFKSLETEIDELKKQLIEAKNGLKAASRLGEQLEKKTQRVSELEEKQSYFNTRITELEQSLSAANQTNEGKIDKSLIKNLVVGYLLSPNAERKSQVLRIMASVLDFNQEERDKIGIDINRSGWFSNILHPKGEGPCNNQSLSEAFIKFLENESRPQPQFKLLSEQFQPLASRTSTTNPKPSGRLSELTLPTFNSAQDSDSSIILKHVLKDS